MIADLTEQCDDFLRIADVHLAAEGLDIEQFYAGHVTPLTLFNSIDSMQFTRRKSTAFAFCTTHSAFSGLSYSATRLLANECTKTAAIAAASIRRLSMVELPAKSPVNSAI